VRYNFNVFLYRLFLISVIVAMKFHEEMYVKNSYFLKAAVRHCFVYSIEELNQLESTFLEAIDYKLVVQPEELDRYYDLVNRKSQELQCKQFKIIQPEYNLIEDYFYSEQSKAAEETHITKYQSQKLPPVFLSGRLFKDQGEVFNFFNCEDIHEDSTRLSNDSSFSSLTDDSPRFH
jgi:hypothetical protein